MSSELVRMSQSQLESALREGSFQCLVEAKTDGVLRWDPSKSLESEPQHVVNKGDLFWCWNFTHNQNGYFHDYADHAGSGVKIETDVELDLVYVGDINDPAFELADACKSPNWL